MSSVVSAPVRKNDTPSMKGRQPRKFTLENIARIKDWVAQGVGRDDIANRLEVTVGSLQVTCSRLGISLRKGRRAERNGAVQSLRTAQRSIEHIQQGDDPARAKVTMLIQKQNRVAQFNLPLNQCAIEQLALEASVRGWTIADIIGKIVRQVMEKDLVGRILRNGDSPNKV
jgi:hypothetical protein